jgi:hypothetical protein
LIRVTTHHATPKRNFEPYLLNVVEAASPFGTNRRAIERTFLVRAVLWWVHRHENLAQVVLYQGSMPWTTCRGGPSRITVE